jgi:hypothetical protein
MKGCVANFKLLLEFYKPGNLFGVLSKAKMNLHFKQKIK